MNPANGQIGGSRRRNSTFSAPRPNLAGQHPPSQMAYRPRPPPSQVPQQPPASSMPQVGPPTPSAMPAAGPHYPAQHPPPPPPQQYAQQPQYPRAYPPPPPSPQQGGMGGYGPPSVSGTPPKHGTAYQPPNGGYRPPPPPQRQQSGGMGGFQPHPNGPVTTAPQGPPSTQGYTAGPPHPARGVQISISEVAHNASRPPPRPIEWRQHCPAQYQYAVDAKARAMIVKKTPRYTMMNGRNMPVPPDMVEYVNIMVDARENIGKAWERIVRTFDNARSSVETVPGNWQETNNVEGLKTLLQVAHAVRAVYTELVSPEYLRPTRPPLSFSDQEARNEDPSKLPETRNGQIDWWRAPTYIYEVNRKINEADELIREIPQNLKPIENLILARRFAETPGLYLRSEQQIRSVQVYGKHALDRT